MSKDRLITSAIWSLFLLISSPSIAQVDLGGGFRLSGNTQLLYQNYNYKSIRNGTGTIRQPQHFPQFSANLNLYYKRSIKVPVQIYLNPIIQVNQLGINTPVEGQKSLNIFEYLAHPANRIYANPSYKNFTFHVGHFIRPYSQLSVGDIKIFGLGAEYKKDKWNFGIQRGTVQPRVANVAFNMNNGAYKRTQTAFNLDYKQSKSLTAGLSFALTGDRTQSLEMAPIFTVPEQSAVLALKSEYQINTSHKIAVEVANSSWAPNLLASDTLREFAVTNFLIPKTNVLGGIGTAIKSASKFEHFKLNNRIEYRSKNFRTLSYPFMQSDMLDVEFNPQASFLKKKIQTDLVLGYKGSNVSSKMGNRLNIPIVKFSTVYNVNKAFRFNVIYAFNAVRSDIDTGGRQLRSSNNIVRLLPSYQFKYKEFTNVVSLILGLSKYQNQSTYLMTPRGAITNNVGLAFRTKYLKHNFGLSYSSFRTSFLNPLTKDKTLFARNASTTLSFRTKLLKDKLSPYARLTYIGVKGETKKLGSKIIGQLGAQYTINSKFQASLGMSLQNNKQGINDMAPAYREFLGRVGLSYKL